MGKTILHGQEARDALIRGIDSLANAVRVTLGPEGRLVVMSRRAINQSPVATKDGVSVANFCDPSDPAEQMGSDMLREAAQKTVEHAGDGTTTATVLAQALVHAGVAQVNCGQSPVGLERGIRKAVLAISAILDKMKIPAEGKMLEQVATISANGDASIGKLVSEAVDRVGPDGVLTCEESRSLDTYLDVADGMQLQQGMLSPYFVNDTERPECVFQDALILLYEGKLGAAKTLVNPIKLAMGLNKPLLVIAGDYEPEALSVLVANKIKGVASICAIRAAAYGDRRREILRDIAVLTGGKAITEDLGMKLENMTEDYFGKARRVIITEFRTTLVNGEGDPEQVSARASALRAQIESTEVPEQKALLEQRLSGLVGSLAVIKVGAATESEMKEKKDRVEDAMFATKAAAEEGIVPGGGSALLRAAMLLDLSSFDAKELPGAQIVKNACLSPLKQIVTNAGEDPERTCAILQAPDLDPKIGFNAATGCFEDLIQSGVIDPVKVVREALRNAASVACVILKTETLIVPAQENHHG